MIEGREWLGCQPPLSTLKMNDAWYYVWNVYNTETSISLARKLPEFSLRRNEICIFAI